MEIDWTIILSIGGAFGAASTAQYVSHHLTGKREDRKYKKEKYQKFYSPLVFKIIKYIEAEGSKISEINRSLNPDPDLIFASIIASVEENIQYANSDFIRIYEETKTLEMILNSDDDDNERRDFIDFRKFDSYLNAFEQFLTDYLIISKDLRVLSSKLEGEVKQSIAIIKLYKLFYKYCFWDIAKILFAFGKFIVHPVNTSNIDIFIKNIDDVEEITDSNFKPYEQTGDKIHNDCFDELFVLLQKITEIRPNVFNGTKYSIKAALEGDIIFMNWRMGTRINMSRIEDFNI
ncbi:MULTISPECIES: hypothetical protein [Bacillus]|uniref:Uncharacterized protein n=1 Tax=Bacillus thuringiensis subsp. konkukian (strain 97-27) TaxID=281309 RepID=Q5LK68_BACHK|nr:MULTISPECIES: hypothetical protein [Bacillus]AAW31037.1 hypothetical protein pBT9727_0067 [[Bacillus thuringiensis] serovar konkukian str. 97-27]AJI31778.1 hypothetical protein BG06_5452 [Bacillus thuringiensis]QDQ03748.1 hypothetical protein EKQ63_00815 [Bacillus sp. BD59S]QKI23400.1 hypothetical protein FOC86_00265 [Bacillus thuringiensis]